MFSKKNLIATTLVAISLFSCISASATTYLSSSLSGTNSETDPVYLGSGERYGKGTVSKSNGTLYVYKVNVWAPDKNMGSSYIAAPNSGQVSFTANSYTDSGDLQGYYLKWKGTSKSTVSASLTDQR